MQIASIGRLCHPDAQEPDRRGLGRESNGFGAAFARPDRSQGKRLPHASGRSLDRIVPGPVLNDIVRGIWSGPGDAEGIDLLCLPEIENDPLRM